MRIHVLSDLHLDSAELCVPTTDADVLVVAGDVTDDGLASIEWCKDQASRTGRPCLFVPGNHEFRNSVLNDKLRAMHLATRGSAVHLLHNRSIHLGGVRFVGATLWTDFQLDGLANRDAAMAAALEGMPDFQRIQLRRNGAVHPLSPADSLRMHRRGRRAIDQALLRANDERVVVITHHSPLPETVASSEMPRALLASVASDLSQYAENSQASLWVWGHVHEGFADQRGKTRLICNSRGSRRFLNDQFDAGLVIEV